MKPVVVPDASVILKWILKMDEDHVEKALACFLRGLQGRRGSCCRLCGFTKSGTSSAGRMLKERRRSWLFCSITASRRRGSIPATLLTSLDLMRRYGVTFYDASYHAVALKAGGTFVTADDAYVHRAGHAGHVISLKDFPI